MNVIIIGGGIGGLALARALHLHNIRARVFEKTAQFRECGAALTMWPNGMRALRTLGVERRVAAGGWPIITSTIRRPDGSRLSSTPVLDLSREAGAPTIGIRRSVLHAALLDSVNTIPIRTGARCVGIAEDAAGVTAEFEDGTCVRGDLLVGADGLWSHARRIIAGERPPRHLGYALWRGLATLHDPGLRAGHAFETWSRGSRFGMVQVAPDEVYWYAGLNSSPDGGFEEALPSLRTHFCNWHDPIPDVLDPDVTHHALRTDIFDRPPLPRWRQGRIVLLGDAAHPMTPDLGQGACSAVEDAVALASCLARETRIETALDAYESDRREHCTRVSAKSRRLSQVSQLANPVLCAARNLVASLTPASVVCRSLRRIVSPVA